MASLKLCSASTSQAQAKNGLQVRVCYRRSGTCKAPRKRLALVTLQKRSQQSVVAASAAAYGGDGPNGPSNYYRSWGSGDGDFGNGNGNSYDSFTPVSLGVLLAGMMVATWQAGPPAATAASMSDMAIGGVTEEDYFQADRSLVQSQWSSAVTEDSDEYLCCGEGFTADEKELVVPKQYRVREWVFVH